MTWMARLKRVFDIDISVCPNCEANLRDGYLAEAQALRALLESVDGFISIERFESLTEAGKMLSLSFFESEEAVTAWRNSVEHHKAQVLGRNKLFDNYRLRIAPVLRDYGMNQRAQVPEGSRPVHG